MPQKAGALPAEEIALFERWLNAGAIYDGGDPARPLAELVREIYLRPAPSRYARPIPITALAFSGDAKRLAVSGYREVTIWNPAEGTLARRLGGMPERISALAWHPKRNLIAVAGGTPGQWGTVALVDAGHGYKIRLLCDLPEMALSVAFSRDGETIVAGCGDRTMRLFDTATGNQIRVLRQHSDWVQAVAFNPGGTLLVSASRDRTARVFDAKTWEIEASYQDHDTPLLAAAFSPDGSRVFTTARGHGHVWHPGKANKRGELEELGGDARQLATGPFGVAAACADGAVRLYQGEGGRPWLTLTGHHDAVQSIAAAPPGVWLASGSADGEVIVWSLDCATSISRFTAVPR
jgi:WD40 repeat protein